MCGICGLVDFNPQNQVNEDVVVRMMDHLRHRGPDDKGLFQDDHVVFGHRRLSIIDLKGGRQPIFNENGSICVIVNGEIYNFQELRKELEKNHAFSTRSDSEVIVHLWEEFGPGCVDRLRGMFAFALYDMTKQEVFLARDRFGQKPLAYAATPRGFYFCSEIYPLTQIDHVDIALNYPALDDFLSLNTIPAPDTIYRGIRKLEPAFTMTLSLHGRSSRKYWSIDPFDKTGDSYRAAESKVYDLIKSAVRYRMIADVPVAAFSSGGVDSSIIIAFMRTIEPAADIQTVCVGFDDRHYDERPFAHRVGRTFGTTHHEHVVTPDLLGILPSLVRHYGEPYGDPSAVPTWYLSQVTAKHVKVALSGDGGDEMFAGYKRFDSTRLVEIYKMAPRPLRESIMERLSKALPDLVWSEGFVSRFKQFMAGAGLHPAERFVHRHSAFSPEMKNALYGHEFKRLLNGHNPSARFFSLHGQLEGLGEAERLQHIDLGVFLPDDILNKVDIASMAHGLEVRSPFLDHKLAEYVLSLPFDYKYRIFRKKLILKRVGAQFLDKSFLRRRKKGFSLPIGQWFRTSLRQSLRECLKSAPIFADRSYFSPGFIRRVLEEHQSGKINHTGRLWNLWILGEWSKLANSL